MPVKLIKQSLAILFIGTCFLLPMRWILPLKDRCLAYFLPKSKHLKKTHRLVQPAQEPGLIIYRDPISWSSFIWINLGAQHRIPYLQKNTPVVVGNALVGVVDYVGSSCSKVRLITDPKLHPSVQIYRGPDKLHDVVETVLHLQEQIAHHAEIPLSIKEKDQWNGSLQHLLQRLYPEPRHTRLSLGSLSGTSSSLWHTTKPYLIGSGFVSYENNVPLFLVQPGDLLVTSGLDALFPPGLHVAYVTKIHPHKEGDFIAHIEANPVCSLDHMTKVSLLPPILPYKEYQDLS